MAFDKSLYSEDPGFYEYEGVTMAGTMIPNGSITWDRRSVDAALNMDLVDSDVLLASYPKTGQTWTRAMINLILESKDLEEKGDVSMFSMRDRIPFIEALHADGEMGAEKFQKLEHPRFMKSHLPYKLWKVQLDKHPDLKIIQTIRNPKDTIVSYYHHCTNDHHLGGFKGTWDQFFEIFKEKKLVWGDYFEVVAEWLKFFKNRDNNLLMHYEQMKKDHKTHVTKIATFLGYDLSDKVTDLIVEKTSAKNMGPNVNASIKHLPGWNKDGKFVRKAEVGDWVNYFSKEQSEYVDAKCKEYLEPLGLEFEYSE